MEIIENEEYLTGEKRYEIRITQEENINPEEIAECFKKQYPKKLAMIIFSRVTRVEVGMIFVGLKFGGIKK